MKKTSGRVLAFALAFAMVAALLPAIPARALDPVAYIDENGEAKTCDTYTVLDGSTTTLNATGWYVVDGSVQINDRLKITEMNTKVNIILKDGCALTASNGIGFTYWSQGLNIYGQSGQSGTLTAYGYSGDAAIGADRSASCSNSTITINGGIINATASGIGAAIGAGAQSITTVTINGGKITAKAGNGNNVGSSSQDGDGGGAGIGNAAGTSGGSCSSVIINGGTVTATGGPGAAGIGGGYRSRGASNVTINGGTVTATGGAICNKVDDVSDTFYSFGAGIGGGAGLTNTDKVTISGGTIIAIGGKHSGFNVDGARASGIGNYYATDKKNTLTMELNISGGIIYTTSIDDNAKGNQGSWEGVIFDGADGKVYGSPDITEKIDLTAPSEIRSTGISNYTLEVPGDSTLTVGEGGSITIPSSRTLNVGTGGSPDAKLVLDGGTVSNSGTVEVYGDVEGSISGSGKVNYHYKVEPKISFTNVTYGYVQPDAQEIDVANTGLNSVTITKVEHENNTNFTLTGEEVGELTYGSSNKNFTLQPNAGLSAGSYEDTVTVTYKVANSDTPRTATADVSFTVDKATVTVTKPTADTLTYTGEDQALVTEGSVTPVGAGTMKYSLTGDPDSYTDDIPTGKAADTYTVHWKVDGADETNYDYGTAGSSGEVNVTISKDGSVVTPSEPGSEISVTYGDPVTLKVDVKREGASGIALTSAAADQVVFTFKDGMTKEATVNYTGDDKDSGTASVTIEANQVKDYFNIGSNTVNISYGGSINLEGNESGKITVNLSQKPLEFTFTPETRDYEAGNTTITGELKMTTSLVDGDTVTATAEAKVATADAGDNKEVTVAVTLAGADADYYTATNPAGVTVNIEKATLIDGQVTAPTGKGSVIYSGDPEQLLDTAGSAPAGCTVKYAVKTSKEEPSDVDWKETYTDITGQDVGTYYVYWKVDGGTNYKEYKPSEPITVSITKTAPKQTTEPALAAGSAYTGDAKQLIQTAAEYNGGDVSYLVKKDDSNTPTGSEGEWTETYSEITGTDAGTYYVWYKVTGDGNHADVGPTQIGTVEISKAESTVTVGEVTSATYGDEIKLTAKVTATDVTNEANITGKVTFKAGEATLGTATASNGAATLTIKATDGTNQKALFDNNNVTAEYAGNDNISKSTSGEKNVTVSPKELSFSFTADEKTYNGDKTVSGTLTRTTELVSGDSDVQADYTATAASENVNDSVDVTVHVTLSGSAAKYYTAQDPTGVTVKIVKANIGDSAVTAPTVKTGLTYDGTEQELIQAEGSATGGTMKYYVDESAPDLDATDWKDAIADIKAKDAGTYKVWYYVDGDGNHNDTEAKSIDVTIEKKEVTLEWKLDGEDTFSVTYTGTAHTVTATANTGVSGESVNVTVENGTQTNVGSSYTATATALTDVGDADVAKNYKLPEAKTQEYSITKATPTVTVSASADPTYGSDITLTATVTAGSVAENLITGTVTFTAGETELGTGTSDNAGNWTLTLTDANSDKQKALFDAKEVTATYNGNGNIDGGEGKKTDLTVKQKSLEYTVTADGKVYDGKTDVTVSLSPSNLVGSDDVTLTATGNLSSADADTYNQVNLSSVSISGGTDAKYYTVESTATNKDLTGSVTISKATVAFSVTNYAHDYTGEAQNATVTQTAPDGLTLTETTNYEVYYTVKDASGTTDGTRDGKTEAGTYDVWVKLTDETHKNYTFADDKQEAKVGELIISPVLATCTKAPEANVLTYTSAAQALVKDGTATGGNMMYALGDDATSAPESGFSGNIPTGTDAKTYYVWYYVQADSNHTDSEKRCVEVTIKKAPVTFEVTDYTDTYDTKTHTATVTQTDSETPKLSEDDFSVTYGTDGAADKTENKTNVGTYDIYVTLKNDNFKFDGQDDSTRELKLTDKLTIEQAELTLSVTGSAITYGQTLSESNLTGTAKIDGGKEIDGTWAWDTTDAAKYPSVSKDSENTEYTVIFTPTSSDASNFTSESLSKTITIKVNPYQLTPVVVASSVENRDYDGTTSVTGGTLTFEEDLDKAPFNGNQPTATGDFTFTDKNVGENKHVNVSGITLTAGNEDYQLKKTTIENAETTAKITAKPVALTWKGYTDLVYSGKPVSVTAETTDFVGGDTVNLTYEENTETDAGTYTAKASLEGEDANNYSITNPEQEYTIAKSPVTFTVSDNSYTYDGTAKEVTLANTNTSGAPTLKETSGYTVTYGDGDESETNVGDYEIHIKLTENAAKNYKFADKRDDETELTVADKKLTIGKADSSVTDVTITAADGELTYGDEFTISAKVNALGNITGTVTFTAGDTTLGVANAAADGTWTITVGADEREKQHAIFENTTITAEYGGDGNITGSSGSKSDVTVAKKPLTYTVTATGREWNGETGVTVELKATNTVTGDTVTLTATGDLDNNGNAGKYTTVNLTKVTIGGADASFYTTDATKEQVALTAGIEITKADATCTAPAAKIGLTYTSAAQALVEAGTPTGGTMMYALGDATQATQEYSETIPTGTDAKTYYVWYYVQADGNHTDSEKQCVTVTIAPATVSFTIGAEIKAMWPTTETNDDPNQTGYDLTGSGTNFALTMTYDSYNHKANVSQTTDEAVTINVADNNGYKVTYRKDGVDIDVNEVRNAGTYDIIVTFTPTTADGIYNYAFSGQETATRELKIGTITVNPYEVTVIWTHLSYVYHAHPMHPDIRVQNPFKSDNSQLPPGQGLPSGFDVNNPGSYAGAYLVAFAATDDSDVKEYTVTAGLYGRNAGNYTVKNPTATVSIVPAPVTFTVSNNVWDLTGDHPTDVTLAPVWGVVSTTPDKDEGTDHQYPDPGTAIEENLNTEIVYKKNGEGVTPTDAGTYEVWVKIGNTNFRHSATSDGAFHKVGELVLTNNLASVKTYKVTFDAGYEDGTAPEAMENLLEGQMVILPAGLTRDGYLFQGWSFGGITYRPNEEFPMPASDVTFKAEWLDVEETRTVGGFVKQEVEGNEPKPLLGATVTLKQGDNEAGEAITDINGEFSFENLVPGIYNLEVRYFNGSSTVVKTFLVDVEKDNLTGDYILPDGALNTVVEADVTAVVDMEEIVETPSATADEGIYTTDDEETVKNGGSVEFKMTVKGTELNSTQEEQVPVPEDRIGLVVDLELTKTVTGSSSDGTTEIHDSKQLITTVIHLPAEIQGKSSYTVYRFHDTDGDGSADMQTITTSANRDGEYLRVIRDGTAIEIHAKFYSTYVLTWTQSTGVYYTVKLPERVENGSVTVNHRNALRGSTVTLTVTPEEGYALGELTVTDKDGKEVALTDNGDGTYSFKMPYGGVTVKAVFKCLGGENCPGRKFADLDVNAWYHEYTDYVLAHDLMHGISVDRFLPEDTVTRAQMVMVLWNMSGSPVVNYYMTYSDVSEGAWYAEAIRWAASEEIAGGYGNNRFGPDDPITREQMAAMLYRYEQEYGQGGFTGDWMYRLPFTDLDKMSDWAIEAVAWCNMNGVIKGRDSGVFDPHGYARRNEMAAVLMRYCQLEPEEK